MYMSGEGAAEDKKIDGIRPGWNLMPSMCLAGVFRGGEALTGSGEAGGRGHYCFLSATNFTFLSVTVAVALSISVAFLV